MRQYGRYIDTVSIRRLTIRIVAQRDISRYDLDINLVIRRSHHVVSIFSSPEHKVLRVSYCDRSLSVVRRRVSCGVRRPSCVVRKLFYLNIFSSETAHWILTKLHRNDPWEVPYQSCSNCSSWLHK